MSLAEPATIATSLLRTIWNACGDEAPRDGSVAFVGDAELPSFFRCSDLAAASIAAAALAVAELVGTGRSRQPPVIVDRRLASLWFASSIAPVGWELPSVWDDIAGDYRTGDGWIKLHTNRPAHRAAALAVLGCHGDRTSVASAVSGWTAQRLEQSIVDAGGAAAEMRTLAAWQAHPQGRAVASEPLVHRRYRAAPPSSERIPDERRPLQGVRVLDLTRVLAGPVATRFLAGVGADVLRIDPPDFEEPALAAETTLGKRCARLDLSSGDGRSKLLELVSHADILAHGYRPGALAALGLTEEAFEDRNPRLIQVTLDAYGWTGPWRHRRGYDSLVQMSCGISAEGLCRSGQPHPVHLPVQALDHATGYIMACAAIRGLSVRRTTGRAVSARTSLAATAQLLTSAGTRPLTGSALQADAGDCSDRIELSFAGPVRRLRPPFAIDGIEPGWVHAARGIGSAPCAWEP